MDYATHIIGFAGILQTAIFIMIVVEVIGLIRSLFGGSGNKEAAREDVARYNVDKDTKKYDDDIERASVDEEKNIKKGQEDVEGSHNLNEGLAGEDNQIKKDVESQIDDVKEAIEKVKSEDIPIEDLRKNIADMLEKVSKEQKAFRKHYLILYKIKNINNSFLNVLNNIENDENRILGKLQEEVQALKKGLYDKSKFPLEKKYDGEKIIKLESEIIPSQKNIYNEVLALTASIRDAIKNVNSKDQKLAMVDRGMKSELNKIENEIKNIKKEVDRASDNINNEDRKKIHDKLIELGKHLVTFGIEWQEVMRNNTSLIEYYIRNVEEPYNKLVEMRRSALRNR